MLDERGDVGADEVLALAEADDQRRVAAGGDHAGRVLGVDGDEGERALEPPADGLHRGRSGRRRRSSSASSRCAATSVSVSETQLVAGRLELGSRSRAKFSMMPLCTSATRPVGAEVRVRVGVVRRAVGGPAGVADAGRGRRQRRLGDGLLEVGELAGALVRGDASRRATSAMPAES